MAEPGFTAEEQGVLRSIITAKLKHSYELAFENVYRVDCDAAQVRYEAALKTAKDKRNASIAEIS